MPDNRDDRKETPNLPEGGGSGGGGRGPGGGPEGNMRFSRSMLGWILILGAAILLFVFFHGDRSPETMSWVKFTNFIDQKRSRSSRSRMKARCIC